LYAKYASAATNKPTTTAAIFFIAYPAAVRTGIHPLQRIQTRLFAIQ
jgi:hypothetical protein